MMKHIRTFILILIALPAMLSCESGAEDQTDPMDQKRRVLPIIGNRDVEYRMVDGKEVADTIYHTVPSFRYLNQDSIMKSSREFEGKIRVVDFFFTHCPSICPPMTAQMRRLNIATKDLTKYVEYLSFSIDPERDTPSRIRDYREKNSITAKNWNMFTGNEEATHRLAKDFFNGAQRDAEVDGGFAHTPNFILVDREGYVRGIYNGTLVDDVDKLESDIRKLLKEEYKVDGIK